jgi:hypothetical protein
MNIQIVNVFPVRSPYTEESEEYTYPILLLNDNDAYYYWARGVSIPISEYDYHHLILYPKIFEFSKALKYHYLTKLELYKRWKLKSSPFHIYQLLRLLSKFPKN